jgi:NosR/NirI family nitrous oxide reductase transcriptional regulator
MQRSSVVFIFKSANSIKIIILGLLMMLLFGLWIGSSWAADTAKQEARVSEEVTKPDSSIYSVIYKEGKYIGISEGWTGMELEVAILEDRIVGIKVLKVNGTPEFYQKVVDRLPDRIISKGSPDVDVISGATLSSNSMKEAIHHVLEKAEQNQ